MAKLVNLLLLVLLGVYSTVDGHFQWTEFHCLYSSEDLHDMEFIEKLIYNKLMDLQYNSTLGKFIGYTEQGVRHAERWNKDTADLASRKAQAETLCKYNTKLNQDLIFSETVEPQVKVHSVKHSDGSHPAMLMCSAYSFYPKLIKVTWMRNGQVIKGGVTSTEEMADGDWYYQVHSHLEYKPESGEEISCVVEHASFKKPMSFKWDPSMSEPDKSKIAIGASGLVLGLVLSAAGFIYYRKKCSGRILVPT
ncbi:H-2 class II histocompatibility antigen, E-S beta chain-like isoform 1-T1 [Clarias gariepinus]|uniref:H-2 class II histocompatibility antigen, E-S beta chain-like n=1 Tax=Clarias gariepinus TaxID=13013 RepID=UPI00234C47F2|nr:H-2 class II histocompatibility antigen, E-S beta chain-like [Clarias gariepinus]